MGTDPHSFSITNVFIEDPDITSAANRILLLKQLSQLDKSRFTRRKYAKETSRFKRKLKRQNITPICYICNKILDWNSKYTKTKVTVDHIIPVSHTRTVNNPDNLKICCEPCNTKKGSLILDLTHPLHTV